ncbi:MAG: tetratricopeptide repeat protein [Bacteroidia bacterium]
MKIINLVLALTCCFALEVKSEGRPDSLQRLLNATSADSLKVALLFDISAEYSQSDPQKSLETAKQALVIAEKHGWKKECARAFNCIGNNYSLLSNVEEAMRYHRKALSLFTQIGNPRGIAISGYSLASNFLKLSDYPRAQECAYQALTAAEKSGDKMVIYSIDGVIADIFMRTGQPVKALEMFKKTFEMAKKNDDKMNMLTTYGNLANTYDRLGDFSHALENYLTQLSMAKEMGIKRQEGTSLGNIGTLYIAKKDFKKGLEYSLQSLAIERELGSKHSIADVLFNIGSIYYEMNNFNLAEKYAMEALEISREIKTPDTENVALELLSSIYEWEGKTKEALKYYKEHIRIRDTILSQEKREDLTRRELTYEFGKKAATDSIRASVQKNELARKNQVQELQLSRSRFVIYGFAGLCVLILIIGWLFIRQNRLRTSQKTMQLEQRLLRSQMNPHFIFNSLIAIESFIYKNEPKEAGKYLSGFARLMRLILENSREEYVTLEKEIKTLEYYLELQKLRFEDKFTYSIVSEESIDVENIAVPPMLAQPFIENAIEHGIKSGKVKGEISIHFRKVEGQILFEVKDNGIGIEKARLLEKEEKKHQSLATVITRERLSILNRRKADKIRLFIEDIKDSLNNVMGTRVSFSIPFREVG